MSPDDPRHGTHAGYQAHVPDGDYCDPCREAHRVYQAQLWRRRYLMRTDALYVDATGTRRRIQALQTLGWRYCDIATEANVPQFWVKDACLTYKRVHVTRARALAAAYERMCMKVAPHTQPSANARTQALRKGYVPPLAWDDIDNDDRPVRTERGKDVDEAVVLRILAGEVLETTTAERREIMRRWLASGRTQKALCDRMKWKEGRYVTRNEDEDAA